jgi:chromate transporter
LQKTGKPPEEQSTTHHGPTLGKLFLSFLRLGLTAFGGPAMMAHVSELAVKKQKWLDPPTFRNGVVLAQSIPGATVMQAVAYVGLQARGVRGALVSYVGFGLPAFLLMLIFSSLYAVSRSLPWVASVFSGLQVIVVAIVANATFTFGRTSLKHYMQAGLAAASALAFGLGVSPFYVILGAAVSGMLLLKDKPEEAPDRGRHKPFPFVQIGVLLSVLAGGLVGLYVLNPGLFRLALLMAILGTSYSPPVKH